MKYSIVGNGTFGAVVNAQGRYVWCCMNHYGGDPIFNCLSNNDSDETGFFEVLIDDFVSSSQEYVPLTSILITRLVSKSGVCEMIDFAPKFHHFDRMFRPFQLFRIVKRVSGDPMIRIRIRPTFGYNSTDGYRTRGSHHIRYCGPTVTWRVTTTLSVQQIIDESSFLLLEEPEVIVFGQDESFASSIRNVAREFQEKTALYWRQWSLSLCLPLEYQDMLVRAAINLCVQQSEETGGLLSSLTMSHPIGPEAISLPPGKDARVCRLLDECLALPSLREIGLFDVCRKFLEFLKNLIYRVELPQHTYGALGEAEITAERMPYLAGFQGMGEVVNGGVFRHNDQNSPEHKPMYGLLVVALAHAFFDVRVEYLCSAKLFETLEYFALKAKEAFDERRPGPCKLGFFDDNIQFYVSHNYQHGNSAGSNEKPKANSTQTPNRTPGKDDEDYGFGDLNLGTASSNAKKKTSQTGELYGPHTFTAILYWAAADRVARVASVFIRESPDAKGTITNKGFTKAQRWASIADEMRQVIEENAWNRDRNCFTTYWGGTSVGPSLLRLVEVGFLKYDDPRFASTLRAFEEDAFKTAVSPNTFTSNTLLWYAEGLRVSGKTTQARNLVNALMNAYNNAGTLSEAVDLKESKLWGNFPCAAAILSFMRVASRLSKSWNAL